MGNLRVMSLNKGRSRSVSKLMFLCGFNYGQVKGVYEIKADMFSGWCSYMGRSSGVRLKKGRSRRL